MKFSVFSFLLLTMLFSTNIYGQEYAWGGSFGGTHRESMYETLMDDDENTYNIGSFQNTVDFDLSADDLILTSVAGRDIFIQKIDSSGNLQWVKTLNGLGTNDPCSAIFDMEGNILIVGEFSYEMDFDPGPAEFLVGGGSKSLFVLELTPEGEFVDVFTNECDIAISGITVDSLNDIYVSGTFIEEVAIGGDILVSEDYQDALIFKINEDLEYVWSRSFGEGGPWDATWDIFSNEENIFVVGWFTYTIDFDPGLATHNVTAVGGFDNYLLKLDYGGNFVDVYITGNDGDNIHAEWTVGPDGSFYVVGGLVDDLDMDFGPGSEILEQSDGFNDIYVCKYDENLDLIWAKQLPAGIETLSLPPELDAAGNIYLLGLYNSIGDFDPSPSEIFELQEPIFVDMFFLKLDNNGDFLWARSLNGNHTSSFAALNISDAGSVYISGDFTYSVDLNPGLGVDSIHAVTTFDDCFVSKYSACESVVFDSIIVVACDSLVSPSGDHVYYESGTYLDSTYTLLGCENLVLIELIIYEGFYNDTSVIACDSVYWRGEYYHESGVFLDEHFTVNGCDSVYSLNLTINESSFTIDSIENCNPIIWIDGIEYSESTSEPIFMLTTESGCDSLISLHFTLNPLIPSITYIDSDLIANPSGVSYRWLDCGMDYLIIPDETMEIYSPLYSGSYAVEVTSEECVDTSECFIVDFSNVNDTDNLTNFEIYPNPCSQGSFIYLASNNVDIGSVIIFNMLGKEIYRMENQLQNTIIIKENDFGSGVFLIKVLDINEVELAKVKLIVN